MARLVRKLATVTAGGVCVKFAYDYNHNSSFYSGLGLGVLYKYFGGVFQSCVDAETAHRLAVSQMSASRGVRRMLGLVDEAPDPSCLSTKVWGLKFDNCIGIAAGFDKNAEAVDGLFDMGFGLVEIGSVTPLPQPGNPKPRVFRLQEDRSVINRYGFNSDGHYAVKQRLNAREQENPESFKVKNGVLGVNLGKNKTTLTPVEDYVKGVKELGNHADYIVVNVSSPNTPGLRDMQGKKELHALLSKVKEARDTLQSTPPLLVKIAPDLTPDDRTDIADVVMRLNIDGIIISNTTIERSSTLKSSNAKEVGGLSGPILMQPSTKLLREMFCLTDGKIPLIGVGGVSNGHDAYEKIRAGASLVQLYTAFSYDGPLLIAEIKACLKEHLENDGYANVSEAVGADTRVRTVGK